MNSNKYDDDLAERVRRDLKAGVAQEQAAEADWAAFRQRLSAPPAPARWAGWRIPLIAAAAVVVLAVAATAVATRGFGLVTQRPASSDQGTSAAFAGVPVPIQTRYYSSLDLDAARADGATPTPRAVDAPPTATTAADMPTPDAPTPDEPPAGMDLPARPFIRLGFTEGEPPAARLSGIIEQVDGTQSPGGGATGANEPIGYLHLVPATADAPAVLWGAVGPAVAHVHISAPLPGKAASAEGSDGAEWFFSAITVTAPDLPKPVSWTALRDGWNAFALQVPDGAAQFLVTATSARSNLLQQISLSAADGSVLSDQIPAESSAPSEPPATVSTTAPPSGPGAAPITEAARCLADAGLGGSGLTDSGFNLGTLEWFTTDRSLCFFDGRSWWSAALGDDPILVTDVGPFESQAAGSPVTPGRFVVGAVGARVSVTATVGGHDFTPIVGTAGQGGPTAGIFVIPIPADGEISVTATDSGGRTSLTLPGETDLARPNGNGPTGPYAGTYPDPDAGMDALLEGTVTVLNGCVAVIYPAATDMVVIPVFPESTVTPAARGAVLHFRGRDYAAGDAISLAGGFAEGAVPVPARCGDNTYVVSPFD